DKALLCLPPNKAAREMLIKKLITKAIGQEDRTTWTAKQKRWVEEAATKTPCYVYEGLKSLVRSTRSSLAAKDVNDVDAIASKLTEHVTGSQLNVRTYQSRMDGGYPQKPLDELLGLMLLEAEVGPTGRSELASKFKELKDSHGTGVEDIRSMAAACG